jgi:hypothetical protein
MRIYNRNNRQHVRYYLRLLRADLTPIDYWTLVMALTLLFFVILWPAAASAQYDPCEVCQAEHGVAACPCLPVQAEPTPLPVPPPPPVGGTIPPVTAIACIPDGPQPDISGCDDKVFLPAIACRVQP